MTNEKLERLAAQGKTVKIDDTEFEINPLTVNQFVQAQVKGQKQDEGAALMEMLYHSLENEDIDRNGIKNAPAKIIKPLQEAVTEVNDFEDFFNEDEKQEALSKLQ